MSATWQLDGVSDLMARRSWRAATDNETEVGKTVLTWAFMRGADDGNRTRTISLGS